MGKDYYAILGGLAKDVSNQTLEPYSLRQQSIRSRSSLSLPFLARAEGRGTRAGSCASRIDTVPAWLNFFCRTRMYYCAIPGTGRGAENHARGFGRSTQRPHTSPNKQPAPFGFLVAQCVRARLQP